MRPFLPLAALALAACATPEPKTITVEKINTVRVEVPVVMPCVDESKLEPLPPSAMPPSSADIAELANGAAADAIAYRELARRQAALLQACAKKGEGK